MRKLSTAVIGSASWFAIAIVFVTAAFAEDAISIRPSRNTQLEKQTAQLLKPLAASFDLSKYLLTRKVIIQEDATDHPFPELTLNTRFVKAPDHLLSSFLHEQLHWCLHEHPTQTEDAVKLLHRFYPRVPIGENEGARSVRSTYVDLLVCYWKSGPTGGSSATHALWLWFGAQSITPGFTIPRSKTTRLCLM